MVKKSSSKTVLAKYSLQKGYKYQLVEPSGKNFDPEFKPDLTPKEMLRLGVFGGHYFLDLGAMDEFPKNWFQGAKLSQSGEKEKQLNYFKVRASQPLSVWQKKGWVYKDDPYGWFQWYCRYYMGRRLEEEDKRQIKRWKAFRRHLGQIAQNCRPGDFGCRPRQRQALLHWAYDSRSV